ncbi:negative regulator GrlR [Moellerella wisconsensis]|uniref:GrlR family regulatory protein n=1 Tax=Morganellaceae TaxID=1903414 RepID=UPI000E3E2B82|nr:MULTISPECIES: GrlR family regulatory protein [Morganellaceae]RFT09517.1 negative regulator GrlR [Providencia rettgeri]UNH43291.1 negative regulator GrlR [Moellerella wisconsensis]
MKDGIYFVRFRSNSQYFGNGTVVVKGNVINGGDFAYLYRGKANNTQVTLTIERHDKSATSVFGDIDKFNLILNIADSGRDYVLAGHIEGMQQMNISINAKFIGEVIN